MNQSYNFTPLSIPNCRFWYDAADASSLTLSGSQVTQWNDKSGSGFNLTRLGTTGPTYNNTFNGSFPTVESTSGTSNILRTPSLASSNMQTSAGSAFFHVFSYSSGTVIAQYAEPRFYSVQNSNRYDYGPLGANVVYNLPTGFTFFNPQLFEYTINVPGTRLQSYQTGVLLADSNITPITLSYTQVLHFFGSSGGLPAIMKMCEFIGFNRFLTTSERKQVEGYLAWKWGLQARLPGDHPYKSFPPFQNTFPLEIVPISPVPVDNIALPFTVNGLRLWLDGADSSTIVFGTGRNVLAWLDKSGLSNNVSQINISQQPLYNNQTSGLRFDGINDTLSNSGSGSLYFPDLNNWNVFLVGTLLSIEVGTATNPWDRKAFIGDAGGYQGLAAPTQTLQASAFFYDSTNTTRSINSGGISQNTQYVFSYGLNQANSLFNFSRNGSNSTTAAPNPMKDRNSLQIANQYTGAADAINRYLNCEIYEILIYGAMTPFERQQIEAYLVWKWGEQSFLPGNHPFRLSPFPLATIAPNPLTQVQLKFAMWLPTQISGLEYWYDIADPTVVTANFNTLVSVQNKGSSSSFPLQVNAGTPTLNIAFQNKLNLVNLPSATYLTFAASFTLQARSRFVATRPTLDTTTNNVSFMWQNRVSASGNDYIAINGSTLTEQNGITPTIMQTSAITNQQNIFGTYTFVSAAALANNRIALNGNNQNLTTSLNAVGYGVTQRQTFINGEGSQHFGEFLSYNRELTLFEAQQVEGYLAWKWGTQNSMPADHPFRDYPPPPP